MCVDLVLAKVPLTRLEPNMTLRELLIERIHFAMDEANLAELYSVYGDELDDLSDLDLFEIYEEVTYAEA